MTYAPRPTIGNTIARHRFNPEILTTYVATYADGTYGPEKATREEAEEAIMKKCSHCNGKRYTVTMKANMKGPSSNQYQSNNPPYVERRHVCKSCNGTGKDPR